MGSISFLLFIVAIVEISLFSVLLSKEREKYSWFFAFFVLFHAVWTMLHGLLHMTDPSTFLFFGKILFFSSAETFSLALIIAEYIVGGFVSSSFLYFSFVYPENTRPPLFVPIGIILSEIILIPLLVTGKIISSTTYIGGIQKWSWEYGSLWFLFYIFFIVFLAGGLYNLWKKQVQVKNNSKSSRYIFWSLVICSFPAGVVSAILPRMHYYNLDWSGPFVAIGWIIVLSYLIIRHKKMQALNVYMKTLILSVGITLFLNIVFTGISEGFSGLFKAITKTLIFVLFISVGRLLVTNIFKESERKQQEEKLNHELKVLNEDWEEKVLERTKELTAAKVHSETILENLTLGIIEYDESFTILRINKASEQFLGIKRHDLIGKIVEPKDRENKDLASFATVLYPALSEENSKIISKEEFEKTIAKNEITITYPERREIQIMTVPLKGLFAAETPRFVKLLRDVTHENLVDRSKNEFIKIAAHQLRTPLSGTKWALRAILDKDMGPISQRQEEILQKTYDTNKSLIDTVNDFLNVTKIEEGFGYQKDLNNVLETIDEAIISTKLLAKDKKISISFNKVSSEIPLFKFDKIKLLLALKNVIGNAIDYTKENGSIFITIKKEVGYAFITVTDTGMGIEKEEMEQIFTKFYRSEKARKEVPHRSGLGLYITKEVVEKHDGNISIESQPGKGTSVTIRIPMETTT